jgi:hypothetical protein
MEWTKEKLDKALLERISDIEKNGKSARGRRELLKYYQGKKLSANASIKAFCYECMGYHNNPGEDKDCENPICPHYPYTPYSSAKKPEGKAMTTEEKTNLVELLSKGRRKKRNGS